MTQTSLHIHAVSSEALLLAYTCTQNMEVDEGLDQSFMGESLPQNAELRRLY